MALDVNVDELGSEYIEHARALSWLDVYISDRERMTIFGNRIPGATEAHLPLQD